jgi:hypothetical protein
MITLRRCVEADRGNIGCPPYVKVSGSQGCNRNRYNKIMLKALGLFVTARPWLSTALISYAPSFIS